MEGGKDDTPRQGEGEKVKSGDKEGKGLEAHRGGGRLGKEGGGVLGGVCVSDERHGGGHGGGHGKTYQARPSKWRHQRRKCLWSAWLRRPHADTAVRAWGERERAYFAKALERERERGRRCCRKIWSDQRKGRAPPFPHKTEARWLHRAGEPCLQETQQTAISHATSWAHVHGQECKAWARMQECKMATRHDLRGAVVDAGSRRQYTSQCSCHGNTPVPTKVLEQAASGGGRWRAADRPLHEDLAMLM
jgi:hypothetical protein